MTAARRWFGEQNRELSLNGYGVTIWEDGKVLEMDGGGDCITCNVNMLNATESVHVEWLTW